MREHMRDESDGMRDGLLSRRIRGVALVLLLALPLTACSPFDDLMVSIFGRSMRDQASFDPYENPMPPPEGSVPFAGGNMAAGPFQVNLGQAEGVELPPPFTAGQVAGQAEVVMTLENPVAPDSASLARGEELYVRNCAPCHAESGIGAEAPLAEVHPTVAVFDVAGLTAQGYPDGYIYGIIRVGRGLMPAYGHRIGHFDRWHIVNYVRQLQGLVPEGGVGEVGEADVGEPAGEG